MLEHRQIGCADELTKKCLKYFGKNAASLTSHVSFLSISHEHLLVILARNSLCIREIDLYRAVSKWGRAQLSRVNKPYTHEAIRDVLGNALFLIRFPIMHPEEFTNGPAKDDILSAEEKVSIYGRIHSAGTTSCAFSAEPRTGVFTLPFGSFARTYCPECGARQNGATCGECGCSYRSIVQCNECGECVEVDEDTSNGSVGHDDECNAVA